MIGDRDATATGPDVLGHDPRDNRELRVKLYDFKRPDKFSKDQIRTIHIIHETVARLQTTTLAARLRCPVSVKCALVDQLTFDEFVRDVPNPSLLAAVGMRPLKGSALLQLDPAVSDAMIDLALGGTGRAREDVGEHSEMERAVLEPLLIPTLANLGEAWKMVLDLEPQLGRTETNPHFCQIVPPNEMVLLVGFEVVIGNARGMMNLCIPYITIEPIIGRLALRYLYTSVPRPGRSGRSESSVAARVPMDVELCVDAGTLSLRELGALRRGTLIPLDEWTKGRAFVRCGRVDALAVECSERNGSRYAFAVRNRGISKTELGIIGVIGDDEIDRRVDERVDEPVSVLKKELHEGFSRLQRRIDDLAARQDEMGDQVLLSAEAGTAGSPDPSADLETSTTSDRMFGFVRPDDGDALLLFLRNEHPQIIAVALSNVSPAVGSYVLEHLESELQVEVTERIYRMRRVAPQILNTLRRRLEQRFSELAADSDGPLGGPERAVDILNLVSRSTEAGVITELETRAPEVADDIKQHMFVFEDIVLLDGRAVEATAARANEDDVVLALRGVSDDVRRHVLDSVDPSLREYVGAESESRGPVRLSDVQAAQQRIVEVIRRLESEGVIRIARTGEDELVE